MRVCLSLETPTFLPGAPTLLPRVCGRSGQGLSSSPSDGPGRPLSSTSTAPGPRSSHQSDARVSRSFSSAAPYTWQQACLCMSSRQRGPRAYTCLNLVSAVLCMPCVCAWGKGEGTTRGQRLEGGSIQRLPCPWGGRFGGKTTFPGRAGGVGIRRSGEAGARRAASQVLLTSERRQCLMAGSEMLILCSGMEPGLPGGKAGIPAPRPARGRKQHRPDSCPLLKARLFQGGNDCKNRHRVYCKGHSTACGRAVYLSPRHSSNTPEAGGPLWVPECGMRQTPDEATNTGTFFWRSVFLWPVPLFYFSHLTRPRGLLDSPVHLLAKTDSGAKRHGTQVSGLGTAWRLSDSEASLCTCAVGVSLTPRMGYVNSWSFALLPLATQPALIPIHFPSKANDRIQISFHIQK